MDAFKAAIKSQVIALSGWDMTAGIANVPFTYYYKNPNSDPAAPFMPSDLLIDSLLRTLQEFPIL
ncbi:hypothetical protein LPJ61_004549, partial [Coemansia biformis]